MVSAAGHGIPGSSRLRERREQQRAAEDEAKQKCALDKHKGKKDAYVSYIRGKLTKLESQKAPVSNPDVQAAGREVKATDKTTDPEAPSCAAPSYPVEKDSGRPAVGHSTDSPSQKPCLVSVSSPTRRIGSDSLEDARYVQPLQSLT